MGLTIFHRIFFTFNMNVKNILKILPIPQNIVMDVNNVMPMFEGNSLNAKNVLLVSREDSQVQQKVASSK